MKITNVASPLFLTLLLASIAGADINIPTVPIGNAGNTGELSGPSAGGYGADRTCGGVSYPYRIGTYEVTAGQYTAFLNAVALSDTYLLYSTQMWTSTRACGIERIGVEGQYTYSVAPEWADRPVNYVNYGDAARFANWLHNGQPTGPQGPGTTEDGAYQLDGAMTRDELMAITRDADAVWFMPSEDEWYKAAYHKNDGVTGNYWDYPTATDVVPSNDLLTPDPGNNANFIDEYGPTLGDPFWRTPVGAFANSPSPYGTFDQGGNVFEWTESVFVEGVRSRSMRGGSCGGNGVVQLHAASRDSSNPLYHYPDAGFRVATIPEPGTVGMFVVCAVAILRTGRGRGG